jgi:hypothetical protein
MAEPFSSGARNYDRADGGSPPGYYAERFIHLQHVVFDSFISHLPKSNQVDVPVIHLRVNFALLRS